MRFIRNKKQKRLSSQKKTLLLLGSIIIIVFVFWLVYLGFRVYLYSFETNDGPADAAIVLGAEVYTDQPSPVFQERINHAITLYKEGKVSALIFTGGKAEGDTLSEAEVARLYALSKGVPDTAIYIETESFSTYTNLSLSKPIFEKQGFETFLIVSDPLHMYRAMKICGDLGLNAQPAPTPTTRYQTWKTKLGFLIRELYYLAKYPFNPGN